MAQLRNILKQILEIFAGISFLAMVILTCWQVFTRYVLKEPSSWSEELVSFLFAWMSLLGASLITGERGHMNIPILIDRLSVAGQKFFAVFGELVACLFSAVILLYGGVRITSLAMGQMTSSLGVAVGVFYIILPISGVINIIFTVMNIYDISKGNIKIPAVSEDEKKISHTGKEV